MFVCSLSPLLFCNTLDENVLLSSDCSFCVGAVFICGPCTFLTIDWSDHTFMVIVKVIHPDWIVKTQHWFKNILEQCIVDKFKIIVIKPNFSDQFK